MRPPDTGQAPAAYVCLLVPRNQLPLLDNWTILSIICILGLRFQDVALLSHALATSISDGLCVIANEPVKGGLQQVPETG